MELIDLQCSNDLESKFLIRHILNFYKKYILLSGWFSNFIIHIQQVVNTFEDSFI